MANKNANLLNIGDKVDLYLGTGPTYHSKLEDITSSGNLLVSIPTHKGEPIDVEKGQGLQLYFYRTNGRYRVNVRMNGYIRDRYVRLMELQPLSDPQKQQRRESFRLPVELKVLVTYIENDSLTEELRGSDSITEEVTSANLSANGIAIMTKKQYSLGDRLLMRIYLKWPEEKSEPIELIGEVRQTALTDPFEKTYIVGIMFLYMSNDIYSHISRYVMAQEQKRLKQKRLVEGI